MINSDEVINEGFKPLKKRTSSHAEPTTLAKPHMPARGMSFNAETGEKESSQALWEGSSWEKFGRSRGKTMDKANSFVGRANSFVGGRDTEPPLKEIEGAVVIVDPFSTGAFLASEVQGATGIDFCATIQHNDRLADQDAAISKTVEALQDLPFPILAVIPGAETGVELADQLSSRLGLRSNGTSQSIARRNKYYMGETVRAAGVRAVKQEICSNVEQMVAFLEDIKDEDGNLRCVVKPVQSAGTWLPVAMECVGYTQVLVTLDVYLGGGLFESIAKDNFPLRKAGREVDMVSRNGGIVRSLPGDAEIRKLPSFRSLNWEVKPGDYCHKTIDCFTRPGCVQLVADTEEDAERDLEAIHTLEHVGLIDYAVICPKPPTIGAVVVVDPFSTGVNMAATVLKYGYKLIMLFSELDSPVSKLVAKGNNMNPTLMIQHDNRNPNQEEAIQATLSELENHGLEAFLVSHHTGNVVEIPGLDIVRDLPSFRRCEMLTQPGSFLRPTVDCFTRPGTVQLVNKSASQLEVDHEVIRKLELSGLFDLH
eukprot:gene7536-5418_t